MKKQETGQKPSKKGVFIGTFAEFRKSCSNFYGLSGKAAATFAEILKSCCNFWGDSLELQANTEFHRPGLRRWPCTQCICTPNPQPREIFLGLGGSIQIQFWTHWIHTGGNGCGEVGEAGAGSRWRTGGRDDKRWSDNWGPVWPRLAAYMGTAPTLVPIWGLWEMRLLVAIFFPIFFISDLRTRQIIAATN